MENQENNNLSELDQLKAQYETLKEQLDQQEIVNDRLMKSSIKSNVDFYMRYRWKQYILYPLAILAGLLITKWEFGNNLSLRLFWIAYLLVGFTVEMWMLRKLHVKTLENNDLLTLSNQARSFKLFYTLFTILCAVSMLILTVGLFAHAGYDHFPSLGRFLTVLCFALVWFVVFGVIGIRRVTRPCDEIIRQIEAFEPAANKKTGFDKRQKWFCVIMFVAFLCLDVWAYLIVASHLKLPPMWHTVKYERAANDLSTEGKLAIWEVYADTVVPEKDVPVLMENWQLGDSLVFMKGKLQKAELGINDQSIHSWKTDNVDEQQVRLYLLKKATTEGPAISSAVLGGKPMVTMMTTHYPRKYPSTESVPMIVQLTPEAGQLWYHFTTEIAGHRAALVMDGEIIQDWQVMCGLDNSSFFIMRDWSSKDELKDFCNCLIKQ
jgi:hypothetical protein